MHQNPRGWRWKRKELKWICHLLQNLTGKEKRERVDWTERWVIDERESSSWGRSSQWFVDHECSDEAEEGLHWLHNSVCVCAKREMKKWTGCEDGISEGMRVGLSDEYKSIFLFLWVLYLYFFFFLFFFVYYFLQHISSSRCWLVLVCLHAHLWSSYNMFLFFSWIILQ